MTGESFDYEGKHLSVKGAKLLYPPVQKPYPPVCFGGSSAAAHELAAEQVDTYLTWGEPPAEVATKVADVRARAAQHGRTRAVRHPPARDRARDRGRGLARRRRADQPRSTTTPWSRAQAAFAQMDSEGQRRMAALHAGGNKRTRAEPGDQRPTSGPASAWCAAAPARRWWATRRRWRRASRSTRSWGSKLHLLGLSAPGGGVPLRRTGVPAAAAQAARRSCRAAR